MRYLSFAAQLIEKKMVSFKPYETKGSYALIKLAKQGQNEQLMKLLHQNAYLVHDFDEESRTALHWAVLKQHVDSTKLLLACNAHPAALDAYGKSVLDYGL
jgi:ankyrin repeat protein